jgi:hypothetical protein
MLGGNVGETVPAVARQLLFWRIRRRVRVGVRHHDRGIGFGKRQTTSGTVNQREQQADGEQQNKRQSAKPTSDFLI